jgi:hypothetical protein
MAISTVARRLPAGRNDDDEVNDVAGKRRGAKRRERVERDTAESGAPGAHLGHSAARGLVGEGQVKVDTGRGRTSFDEEDTSAGGALGPEGTRADMNRPIADRIRDAEDHTSRHPEQLGLGPGDPGYTAEEDDAGTDELARR